MNNQEERKELSEENLNMVSGGADDGHREPHRPIVPLKTPDLRPKVFDDMVGVDHGNGELPDGKVIT